ncbi:two-component system, NtrC family, response regulator HydG [Desulfomicrobium apsheronum]|uniref:Two-component system, NtrC family, response regulator HydG n=1 Tax=Desulfomicrobium apsheronum TaxID=52560 RepID=A0A1I3WGM7_9BACT|nr:sigma-54 dependent transcriptional regulator [Desulfomicrobium apsheronum]SFK06602.1 two-component system, NtrC family, response regulator HydG [Desulfomicrobium apsheronum]
MKARILVVDDDRAHMTMLVAMLGSWGYEVDTADDGAMAVTRVRERAYDVVLTDVRMAEVDGIEALRQIKSYNPYLPVLIMTAYSSVDVAVQALKAGALDYLHKPLDFGELRMGLERALEQGGAQRSAQVGGEADPLSEMIGDSPPMRELAAMIRAVAPSEASVLILGESGTGKELVAKALHEGSPRKARPMITVNCAALAENLLESELFGHEKGAYTGAQRQRDGRFVQADGGTLFLDEIGEMAPALQAKLLRALQQGEVQRLGSDRSIRVDVRVLAATNRDLEAEVRDGGFREDLYYRLNVIALRVPALRERPEDIPLLARHFLHRFAERNRKSYRGFSPRVMDLMLHYDWPGNVRELENVVERAVILSPGEFVTENDLPATLRGSEKSATGPSGGQSLEDAEREAIARTLEQVGNNKSEAARVLGVTRVTLRSKMKKFGLDS